jgi:hypothetical protein
MVHSFLGNSRKPDYKEIMQNYLEHSKNLGCSVRVKLNSMPSHAVYFPQNLGNGSHEYYERFHPNAREMDKRSQDG